jgi:hypothetical protein
MIKKYTFILNSPLGYKYKCVFICNYIGTIDNKINGTFYIGNPKTKVEEACVTITVFFPSDNRIVDPSIASLLLIKYYETCSENKILQQGEGTVDMIKTSMSIVKQICPFINEFKFNDASTKRCDNGTVISLPYFYITQNEITWYEGKFNAYLKEPFYTAYKKDLQRIMNTTLPRFEEFVILYFKNTPQHIKNELKSVYKEGDILKGFFKNIYQKYDKRIGCILIQPWIDYFMSIVGLQKYISMTDWYISSDIIPVYNFRQNLSNQFTTNTYNNTRKKSIWNKR